MSAALEARGITAAAGGTPVLHGVDLTLDAGEWVGIIGPNGAGKSTLLRVLAGLSGYSGSLRVLGEDASRAPRRRLARVIALVPQQPHAPIDLTVAEYVLLGRTPHLGYLSAEGPRDRAAAERALVRLSLRDFAHRVLGSLSGGELQRAHLARALAQEPSVLLLDEPTSALDLGRQQMVLELVDRLRRESSLAVVTAMHDLSLAAQFADRLLLLDRGRVLACGPPREVLTAEGVSRLYGAEVRVLEQAGAVYVLPVRGVDRCRR